MKMKVVIVSMIPFLIFASFSNSVDTFKSEPYFSAVIVNNIDSSAAWYKSVFGLNMQKQIDEPSNGFRIAVMESPQFLLELIQNKSWPAQKQLLKNMPAGTHIQGFFKIGFKVEDIDACIKHLKNLNVTVEHVYTDSLNKKNFLITDPDGNLIQFYN